MSYGVRNKGACDLLPAPQSFMNSTVPASACDPANSPVLQFDIDDSNLASVEQIRGNLGFIGKLNLSVLSSSEMSSYLNGANIIPTAGNITSSFVTFRKYISNNFPNALTGMEVQVGNTIAELPIDLPPEPNCTLTLNSPLPTHPPGDPGFRPGDSVNFILSTDSITRSAQVSTDGGETFQNVLIPDQQLNSQSVANVLSPTKLTTFTLNVPLTPLPGTQISSSTISWEPKVQVFGVRGNAPTTCSYQVAISAPTVTTTTTTMPAASTTTTTTTTTLDCFSSSAIDSTVPKKQQTFTWSATLRAGDDVQWWINTKTYPPKVRIASNGTMGYNASNAEFACRLRGYSTGTANSAGSFNSPGDNFIYNWSQKTQKYSIVGAADYNNSTLNGYKCTGRLVQACITNKTWLIGK